MRQGGVAGWKRGAQRRSPKLVLVARLATRIQFVTGISEREPEAERQRRHNVRRFDWFPGATETFFYFADPSLSASVKSCAGVVEPVRSVLPRKFAVHRVAKCDL